MCLTLYGYHAALCCAAGESVTRRRTTVLVVLIDAAGCMCIAFAIHSFLGMPSELASKYSMGADNALRTDSWRALRMVQLSHHPTCRPRNADFGCDGA